MKLPDVNVLINAYRQDAAPHMVARSWLNETTSNDARFAISKLSLASVVRIMTDRRAYAVPTTLADAFAFCDGLLAQPNCQMIEPGDRHWQIFRELCVETGTRGGDTTDAWYAALAIEWGCEWVTFDRDFLKFRGLRCTILSALSS
jgi:toxin-antitoxin system PIN domain toxin